MHWRQKFGETHTADIVETKIENGVFSILGHSVTLTFDLLTTTSNQYIFAPRRTTDKRLVKMH